MQNWERRETTYVPGLLAVCFFSSPLSVRVHPVFFLCPRLLPAFGLPWCWCLLKMGVGEDILLSCYCCCLPLWKEGSGYCAALAYCCSPCCHLIHGGNRRSWWGEKVALMSWSQRCCCRLQCRGWSCWSLQRCHVNFWCCCCSVVAEEIASEGKECGRWGIAVGGAVRVKEGRSVG